jgi:hypothetical protein
VPDIADDADHGQPRRRVAEPALHARRADATSDGAFSWPVLLGHHAIDDDPAHGRAVVGGLEVATGEQRNPQRVEVFLAHDPVARSGSRDVPAFELDEAGRTRAERDEAGDRCTFDTGGRPQ